MLTQDSEFLLRHGVGDYFAAQALLLISDHTGDDNYYRGRTIADAIDRAAAVSPDLREALVEPARTYVRLLPEPQFLTENLYLIDSSNYRIALGRVLGAIGDYEQALDHFRTLEAVAQVTYQRDRDPAALMYGMGYRLKALREMGRDEAAVERCSVLESTYPAAYADEPPTTCLLSPPG